MNFAIPFTRKFKYLNDENLQLNIVYKPKIKELSDFIAAHGQNHRINIFIEEKIEDDRDLPIFQTLLETYPNYKIVICLPYYSKELEQKMNDNNIPHYYSEIVTDWDTFNGFLELNITDIFIGENICFFIPYASEKAKKKQVFLRAFCNICQSPWENTPSLKNFFVRPEDIELYENYIDTFEFFFNTFDSLKLNVLYEIYKQDQKWFGLLNEIILGLKEDIDNRFLISYFGERRLSCRKRCMYEQEPTCHICDRIAELSRTLKDKNLYVTIEKENNGDKENGN